MTMDNVKSLQKDDFLNLLGLETKRTNVDYLYPALAIFGAGVLIGTGIGLLVAPKSGRQLREDIAHRLQQAPDAISKLPQKANDAFHRASEQLADKVSDSKFHDGKGVI